VLKIGVKIALPMQEVKNMNVLKSAIILALITVTAVLDTAAKDKKQKEQNASKTPVAEQNAPKTAVAAVAQPQVNAPKTAAAPAAQPQVETTTTAPEAPSPELYGAITWQEKRLVREYIEGAAASTPRGRTAHKLSAELAGAVDPGVQLESGWEKKLLRGEILTLPVFSQCKPLPREIAVRLPAAPAGTVLVALEGRIIRLVRQTRQILDVYDAR